MKGLIFALILLSGQALGQTLSREFRIDSAGPAAWYFVTSNVFTDAAGDKQVQEYQRFFDNKDSTVAHGIRVRDAIVQDSLNADRARLLADSSKARVQAVLDLWDPIGGGGIRSAAPPPNPQPATIEPAKATTQPTKKRRKHKE